MTSYLARIALGLFAMVITGLLFLVGHFIWFWSQDHPRFVKKAAWIGEVAAIAIMALICAWGIGDTLAPIFGVK